MSKFVSLFFGLKICDFHIFIIELFYHFFQKFFCQKKVPFFSSKNFRFRKSFVFILFAFFLFFLCQKKFVFRFFVKNIFSLSFLAKFFRRKMAPLRQNIFYFFVQKSFVFIFCQKNFRFSLLSKTFSFFFVNFCFLSKSDIFHLRLQFSSFSSL